MAKIVYLVSEDWFFASHFMPMARAARAAGFEVAVVARYAQNTASFRAEGIETIPFDFQRKSINPLQAIAAAWRLGAILRRLKPDIVHSISLKPVLIGGIAARLAGVRAVVSAVTGTGAVFAERSPLMWVLQMGIGGLMRLLGRHRGTMMLVENEDHAREFVARGWTTADRVVRVVGAGVDLDVYRPQPPRDNNPVVATLVGRMLEIKGVVEAVTAVRRLADEGVPLKLMLVGEPDPDNPATITEKTLRDWSTHPAIDWRGPSNDVVAVWAESDIAVLVPRGGDGLPKSLLEAAACGRPIITSDTPGCRDALIPGETGLLVAPGDVEGLMAALRRLVEDSAFRLRCGLAGRALAEASFSEREVARIVVALYSRLLGAEPGTPGFTAPVSP